MWCRLGLFWLWCLWQLCWTSRLMTLTTLTTLMTIYNIYEDFNNPLQLRWFQWLWCDYLLECYRSENILDFRSSVILQKYIAVAKHCLLCFRLFWYYLDSTYTNVYQRCQPFLIKFAKQLSWRVNRRKRKANQSIYQRLWERHKIIVIKNVSTEGELKAKLFLLRDPFSVPRCLKPHTVFCQFQNYFHHILMIMSYRLIYNPNYERIMKTFFFSNWQYGR